MKDFDKAVIGDVNSITGLSLSSHDFNAGGHMIFLGVRYHY